MKKTKKIIIAIGSIVVLVGFIFSMIVGGYILGYLPTHATHPERHVNIPEEAFWQGGVDGGSWYKIQLYDIPNYFIIEEYNDFTGEIERKGIYKVESEELIEIYTPETLKQIFKGIFLDRYVLSEKDGIKVYLIKEKDLSPLARISKFVPKLQDDKNRHRIRILRQRGPTPNKGKMPEMAIKCITKRSMNH